MNEARNPGGKKHRGRTIAEWVSLGIALLVLAGVVGTVIALWLSPSSLPARFVVERGAAREVQGLYYLEVTVRNVGDETAAEVEVEGVLGSGAQEERSSTVFDFIPGHSEGKGVLIFSHDPSKAVVRVTSYQKAS